MATMLSSIKKGEYINLSNNNLTAQSVATSGYGGVVSVDNSISVGSAVYFEITIDIGGTIELGVVDNNYTPFTTRYLEYESSGQARFYRSWDGTKGTEAGTVISYGTSYSTGDIIGVAINLETYTLTFYKNGINLGIAFNNLNLLNGVYPALSFDSSGKVTFNFGSTPFVYSIPTGYKAYDSPPPKFLIKQNTDYYTIKSANYDSTTLHSFIPLTLTGGTTPNKSDIETFGFDDLSVLTNSMNVGDDTFSPINKFDNTAELKMYKG